MNWEQYEREIDLVNEALQMLANYSRGSIPFRVALEMKFTLANIQRRNPFLSQLTERGRNAMLRHGCLSPRDFPETRIALARGEVHGVGPYETRRILNAMDRCLEADYILP